MAKRRAEFPKGTYHRPPRTDDTATIVTVIGENGEELGTYDFGRYPPAGSLRQSIARGFLKATSSGGRWRTSGSCKSGYTVAGNFLKFVERVYPEVVCIADVSPEVWLSWREDLEKRVKWPGQINLLRVLLMDVQGVSEATLRALRTRAPKPRARSYNAYSREEFARIKRTYTSYVVEAERRIASNLEILMDYWAGQEDPREPLHRAQWENWSKGQILDHLATTGGLPESMRRSDHSSALKEKFGLARLQRLPNLLYPSPMEIMALVALMICERGYNSSVIFSMEVPTLISGLPTESNRPVYSAHLDKPRRGPARRYFTSNFVGNESRLMERVIRMTQPARYTLEQLGYPTNQLFIALATQITRHPSEVFLTDWSTPQTIALPLSKLAPVLSDDGLELRLNLRRLRLTEQVHSQRSRQNSQVVSEEIYRRSEPATIEQASPVILQGQQEALLHAHAFVEIRTVTSQDIAPSDDRISALSERLGVDRRTTQNLLGGILDTATTACTDFFRSPFSTDNNGACAASFLMCLACDNAVAAPHHLPRLVALNDALRSISSTVTQDRWNREFSVHFARLQNLLSRLATDAEIAEARRLITEETENMVTRLIGKDLDS